ncbi:MAG: carbohydrate-binding domain-containing protein [Bacteroidales bacterium]|nr:carbohydrate-binding domain-containing protein [Bacteroidales bacterium]
MRKTLLITALMVACIGLYAQDYYLNLHRSGSVVYDHNVNGISDIRFEGSQPANMLINTGDGVNSFAITAFDSITFVVQELPPAGDTVYLIYSPSNVSVVNPFANDGVSVTTNGGNVTVSSTKSNVPYVVSGTTANGSLTLYSSNAYHLTLSSLSLTSNDNAALNLASVAPATLILKGNSSIADGANSSLNAALYAAGSLTVNGSGTLEITGNAKHGINVEGTLTVNGGSLSIPTTDSDGIHGSSNLIWNDGTLDIVSPGSDGLDISGDVTIQNGNLSIHTTAESQRGIKVSGIFTMNDGTLTIHNSGQDGKGIKGDGLININGGHLTIEHSGDMSKGIKCDADITITGGTLDITSSGSTVLESVDGQNVPAYCTAIKCDTDIHITGGEFTITLPTSNHGGKGISADGSLTIDGGHFVITTQGNGASYTVSGNTKDAYTSACLRSDGNMSILSGQITLNSSGTGGKGINVGDDDHTTSTLTLGTQGGNDDGLILNVTTSGERITITSGGGGPWGGGDYANPKGVKSRGNLTINSGTITVNCTQNNEGGECIESKSTLTINGGHIETYSKTDDPINAAQNLTINGGTVYSHSDNNDGIDSNGTMFLNGGFVISNGARQPEEGFDCDNNQFKITGGTHIGTGGGTSNPTQNVCTQPSLKINTQPGYAIQITKSDGTIICTYQCPQFTGSGGGGWPGGGGNSMVMLFTDPQLQTGQSYTVKYGGTISGGTNWNGYYTGNVTYSGGQSTSVNVNSMVTTVSAGGGGGW